MNKFKVGDVVRHKYIQGRSCNSLKDKDGLIGVVILPDEDHFSIVRVRMFDPAAAVMFRPEGYWKLGVDHWEKIHD